MSLYNRLWFGGVTRFFALLAKSSRWIPVAALTIILIATGTAGAQPDDREPSQPPNPDEKTRVIRSKVEVSPQQSKVAGQISLKGEELLLDGRYDKARVYLERAVDLDPNNPRTLVALTFCTLSLGDFESAATSAHDVMGTTPDLAATALDGRSLLGETNTFEKQLGELEKIAQLQPESSRMRYLLGFVRYFSGQREPGAQLLLEYRVANPDDWSISPFIAIAEASIGTARQPGPAQSAVPAAPPPTKSGAANSSIPRSGYTQPRKDSVASKPPAPPTRNSPPAYVRRPPAPKNQRYAGSSNRTKSYSREPLHRKSITGANPPPPPATLEDVAVNEFCRATGLDPAKNDVYARVTDEDYDDESGLLTKAKFKMRWLEWKHRDRHGSPYGKAKQKSDSIKLRFDKQGRVIEYDD